MKSFITAVTIALMATLCIFAVQSAKAPKNPVTCVICTDLVELVDEAVLSNKTLEQVTNILYAACDILVGMEQTCKDFVDEQLPIIIDLLVEQYLKPEEVCEALFLCP